MHFYKLAHFARITILARTSDLENILPALLHRSRPLCLRGEADWVGQLAATALDCTIPLVLTYGNECSGGVE